MTEHEKRLKEIEDALPNLNMRAVRSSKPNVVTITMAIVAGLYLLYVLVTTLRR
jgi:hypothetical protein